MRAAQTAHPGVTIIPPTTARPYFQVRYEDPVQRGRNRQEKLPGVGTPEDARRQALQLSERLRELRGVPTLPTPAPQGVRARQESRTKGVVILRPSACHPYYRARFTDPTTGARRTMRLHGVTSHPAALAAAETLSQTLQQRGLQVTLAGGREYAGGTTLLVDEAKAYVAFVATKENKHGKRTSECTLRAYRDRLAEFCDWCARTGVTQLGQLSRPGLSAWFVAQRTAPARAGALRGKPRTTTTFNQCIKPIRQMLVAAAVAGRLTHISSDAVRDVLQRQTEPAPVPRVYSVTEMREILQAALDYDVHPDRQPNTPAIAPAVAVALLTGMRRGELSKMQVRWVHFDAPSEYDPDIRTGVDLIRIPGKVTKIGLGRDVLTTQYSPLLAELLRALCDKRAPQERVLRMGFVALGAHSHELRAHGAPADFRLKDLRSTCATYQTPLPGSHKAHAGRQGHTLSVAETHYLKLRTGMPAEAPNLDVVMKVQAQLRAVIERVTAA